MFTKEELIIIANALANDMEAKKKKNISIPIERENLFMKIVGMLYKD